jgi:hypothetical protein
MLLASRMARPESPGEIVAAWDALINGLVFQNAAGLWRGAGCGASPPGRIMAGDPTP